MNTYYIMHWCYLQYQAFLVFKDGFHHWKYKKCLLKINDISFCQIVIDHTFITWNVYCAGDYCSWDVPAISLCCVGRYNSKIIGFGSTLSAKLYSKAYAAMAKLCYSYVSSNQKIIMDFLPNFLDVFFAMGKNTCIDNNNCAFCLFETLASSSLLRIQKNENSK